jgi:diaminopimelate decarboxylase
MALPEYLHRRADGQLLLEGHCLKAMASQFGTPLYIVSAAAMRHAGQSARRLVDSYCPGGFVCYAYKANALASICALLDREGIGAEVSSPMELRLALDIGVEPGRIIFNGPLKSDDALRLALKVGVGYLNADSFAELQRIDRIAMERGRVAEVGLRIGPRVAQDLHGRPTRFGVDCANELALRCLREARQLNWVRLCGLQFHLGTQIGSIDPYARAISEAVELMSRGLDEDLLKACYLDIGGGFAVAPSTCRPEVEAYGRSQVEENLLERVLEYAARAVEPLSPRPRIIIEPGRALVARSVVLLTRVISKLSHKVTSGFIVDAGQSMVSSNLSLKIFHDVLVVKDITGHHEVPTNLYGCLCYESDIIALGLPLPPLVDGDLIVVLDCGAYDMPLASSFIVPRPAVVLVDHRRVTCVQSEDPSNARVS